MRKDETLEHFLELIDGIQHIDDVKIVLKTIVASIYNHGGFNALDD